jgi:hypothetical protein
MPKRHAGHFHASLGSMFRKPHPPPSPPFTPLLYGMDHDPFKHKTLCSHSGIWGFYHMDP